MEVGDERPERPVRIRAMGSSIWVDIGGRTFMGEGKYIYSS